MKTLQKSEIVNKLHVLIYLYLTFGWMISQTSSKILLLMVPTVLTKWGIKGDECFLTQLETKYKQRELEEQIVIKKKDDDVVDDIDDDDIVDDDIVDDEDVDIRTESFLKTQLDKYNIRVTDKHINLFTYMMMYHSFVQSYIRVIFY